MYPLPSLTSSTVLEMPARTHALRRDCSRIMPRHIAFIMDGNGRWATMRGLQRSAGHRYGREHILKVADMTFSLGVPVISCFAWSTENWQRPQAEVDYIMQSTEKHLLRFARRLDAKKIRFVHTGSRAELPAGVLRVIDEAVALTSGNSEHVFNLVLNYSGRAELLDVARQLLAQPGADAPISVEGIQQRLWTAALPDVDLIFRSSGEQRISNYMLWQSAHAHLYVTDTHWPLISRSDIEAGIDSYNRSLDQHEQRYT